MFGSPNVPGPIAIDNLGSSKRHGLRITLGRGLPRGCHRGQRRVARQHRGDQRIGLQFRLASEEVIVARIGRFGRRRSDRRRVGGHLDGRRTELGAAWTARGCRNRGERRVAMASKAANLQQRRLSNGIPRWSNASRNRQTRPPSILLVECSALQTRHPPWQDVAILPPQSRKIPYLHCRRSVPNNPFNRLFACQPAKSAQ